MSRTFVAALLINTTLNHLFLKRPKLSHRYSIKSTLPYTVPNLVELEYERAISRLNVHPVKHKEAFHKVTHVAYFCSIYKGADLALPAEISWLAERHTNYILLSSVFADRRYI